MFLAFFNPRYYQLFITFLLLSTALRPLSSASASNQSEKSSGATTQTAIATSSESSDFETLRLQNPEAVLKTIYGNFDSFHTTRIAPSERGGTTFMGLVSYLLGDGLHRKFEGIHTEKIIYHVIKDKKEIGAALGSRKNVHPSQEEIVEVFVFYNHDGTVKDIQLNKLPPNIQQNLMKGNFLSQFIGAHTADFENRQLRRKRRKKGRMLQSALYPKNGTDKKYFSSIFRAIRFNAAFMDVAHFITRYPDQVAYHDNQEMPDEVEVIRNPASGPEAFVKENYTGSSMREAR